MTIRNYLLEIKKIDKNEKIESNIGLLKIKKVLKDNKYIVENEENKIGKLIVTSKNKGILTFGPPKPAKIKVKWR